MEARILSALRHAGDSGVSEGELSAELNVTRAIVREQIEGLRLLGYDIVARPHHGYRLLQEPDLLYAPDLLSRASDNRIIGSDIRVVQETTSTNDLAEKFAREGAAEGLVVFAEAQTQGRGRLGRLWHSPPGQGLWFSVLLRPPLPPQAATQLTIMSATALARAISTETRMRPEIKWPNDILLHGRKIAGILTELRAEVDEVKYAIIGLGVNVNLGISDFPAPLRSTASSLKVEAKNRSFLRSDLAAAVLRELDRDYRLLLRGDFPSLAAEWEEQCSTLGRNVTIQLGKRKLSGCAESLDENGALLLRTEHGHLERIIGGDVTLETMEKQ